MLVLEEMGLIKQTVHESNASMVTREFNDTSSLENYQQHHSTGRGKKASNCHSSGKNCGKGGGGWTNGGGKSTCSNGQ